MMGGQTTVPSNPPSTGTMSNPGSTMGGSSMGGLGGNPTNPPGPNSTTNPSNPGPGASGPGGSSTNP
jgi:hypothetical protein